MRKLMISLAFIFSVLVTAQEVMLVEWGSPEGVARLERSKHKVDFFALANHFESQPNRVYCGPTTGSIVLNALRLGNPKMVKPADETQGRPEDREFFPKDTNPTLARYTANTFFNKETDKVKTRAEAFGKPKNEINDFGFQLRQYHEAIKAHGLNSELHVVDDKASVEEMRKAFKKNLGEKRNFVIVNYHRPALGQKGGGHISPIGAYDEKSDAFLIMDVNPTAAPWVWVKADALFNAMKTKDTVENRGYLLVSESQE